MTGRGASGGDTEQLMTDENGSHDNIDELGKTIANVLLACLAAFFLYAYVPHFFG